MKELQDILRQYATARSENRACALATLVRASGSTYRRPGARMLITADGNVTGCISGGCLESAVIEQARRAMVTGNPGVAVFDSLNHEDVLLGFGLGCNGIVEVLIEPLNEKSDHMAFLAGCFAHREDAVLATVFSLEGRADANIGDRMMMRESGEISTNIADEPLYSALANDALRVMNGESQTIVYELADGTVNVLIEHVRPPLALLIFGAGHDAVPLVRLATELGWHVTLVDYRPGNVARARTLGANVVIVARPEEIGNKVSLDPRGAVILMNHNYLDDLTVLETVLNSRARYVGVLGPRVRTEQMLLDLRTRGITWTGDEMTRLYAPAGLDIGAEGPEEIALSIVAEIKAAMSDRTGESLREKSCPLHARIEEMRSRPRDPNAIEESCSLAS